MHALYASDSTDARAVSWSGVWLRILQRVGQDSARGHTAAVTRAWTLWTRTLPAEAEGGDGDGLGAGDQVVDWHVLVDGVGQAILPRPEADGRRAAHPGEGGAVVPVVHAGGAAALHRPQHQA